MGENTVQKLAACIILGALTAAPGMPQDADPPRRAARLGAFTGTVSLRPATVDASTPAEMNRPVTTGDQFWSEADGRGELQTDNAVIRFGGRTNFAFEELNEQATLVKIESGTLSVRLHTLAPHEVFEVETPHGAFTFLRLGQYRINVSEQGDASVVMVRLGDAQVSKADGTVTSVPEGMQARASAGGSPSLEPAPAIDEFDSWSMERDRREDLSDTAHYLSRDIPGYADLDGHGAWRTVDPYGAVWFPSGVDAEWAPYRSGHWVWVDPWGMTWVDDAPWGYAPFHYGRWVQVNGAWGWVPGTTGTPGTFVVRPSYAPALVAWTHFDAGAVRPEAVVGWFPLGPGELWAPGYAVSSAYIARVNLTNTVIVDRTVLANPDMAHANYMHREAITAMGHDELAVGRPVGREFVRVPQTAYARAAVDAQPGLQPTREVRIGPRGPAQGAPPAIANRAVVARQAPSPRPTAFVQREAAPQPAAAAQHAPNNAGASRTPAPVKQPGGVSGALSRITSGPHASGVAKNGATHPPVLPKTKQPKKQ
jgi:hypothetical protein